MLGEIFCEKDSPHIKRNLIKNLDFYCKHYTPYDPIQYKKKSRFGKQIIYSIFSLEISNNSYIPVELEYVN